MAIIGNARKSLGGQEAIDLWLKGKDIWNFQTANPFGMDVDFSNVVFADLVPDYIDGSARFSFDGFRFPKGNVSFDGAIFGKGGVSFKNATFESGEISFHGTTFEDGGVTFNGAKFNDGNVIFDDTTFGIGKVSFLNASFGRGKLSFSKTCFGDGRVSFQNTIFGKGEVIFEDAVFGNGSTSFAGSEFSDDVAFTGSSFGKGDTSFQSATFGDGKVSFGSTDFGDGRFSFSKTTFGKGGVSFHRATFGNGEVIFSGTTFGGGVSFHSTAFGDGRVSFNGATFGSSGIYFHSTSFGIGRVSFQAATIEQGQFTFEDVFSDAIIDFSTVAGVDQTNTFSLRHGTFNQSLMMPEGKLGCVPDLRNCKLDKQVTLHELEITLNRPRQSWKKLWARKAADPEDASRLRRLKEIAETNRDHAQALSFHADEMRAKRWVEIGFFASVLDATFSALSDYGQSIWRPVSGLIIMNLVLIGFYTVNSNGKWGDAIEYTLANSLPFLISSRKIGTDSLTALYGGNVPDYINFLTMGQGVLTVIFLFLIGLGLRNRFRI